MYHISQKVAPCTTKRRSSTICRQLQKSGPAVAEVVCINRKASGNLAGSRRREYQNVMNSNIYLHRKAQGSKPFGYAYEEDPTFQAFRAAVWGVCERNEQPQITNSKLYSLWYVSKTFAEHWAERPTKKLANDVVFILGHNVFTELQCQIVFLAWMKHHFPNLTTEAFEDIEARFFWPTWERIEPSVQAARDRKNARRREKRKTKKMKTQNTTQNVTLKGRILETLTQHPMTTPVLAKKLDAHPKAVDGHLSRMSKRGQLVKIGRGLYALPGVQYSAPVQVAPPVNPKPVVTRVPSEPAQHLHPKSVSSHRH